jgi:hypothetical protein
LFNNNTIINQNEQSLSLRVSGEGLELGDSRAVFKNVSIDMRQFKTENVLHAESLQNETVLRDDQMVGFIRFGNDFTKFLPNRNSFKGDCAFSIIDIRLFSFECTGSVASRKRNRFVISIIDSIENNGNECRFKHAALDGIYYKMKMS